MFFIGRFIKTLGASKFKTKTSKNVFITKNNCSFNWDFFLKNKYQTLDFISFKRASITKDKLMLEFNELHIKQINLTEGNFKKKFK